MFLFVRRGLAPHINDRHTYFNRIFWSRTKYTEHRLLEKRKRKLTRFLQIMYTERNSLSLSLACNYYLIHFVAWNDVFNRHTALAPHILAANIINFINHQSTSMLFQFYFCVFFCVVKRISESMYESSRDWLIIFQNKTAYTQVCS